MRAGSWTNAAGFPKNWLAFACFALPLVADGMDRFLPRLGPMSLWPTSARKCSSWTERFAQHEISRSRRFRLRWMIFRWSGLIVLRS